MELITVKTSIKADVQEVWYCWTQPDHIIHWNFASDDWKCPNALNNLEPGGEFSWRMEAKDGSFGFDYSGIYEEIKKFEQIRKRLEDGRMVNISFVVGGDSTEVIETFEPDENNPDLQRQGWQAILENFRKYVERDRG